MLTTGNQQKVVKDIMEFAMYILQYVSWPWLLNNVQEL
jgi:hypothetical protein